MHPHCGACSQCIDRRFAVLAAKLETYDPGEAYALDLVSGDRKTEDERQSLLDYIAAADRFAKYKNTDDFLASCGEANRALPSVMDALGLDADGAGRAIYEMHKRHGEGVGGVLKDVFAQHAMEIRNGSLPANSMPMLLFSRGLQAAGHGATKAPSTNPASSIGGTHLFRDDGEVWTLRFGDSRSFPMRPHKGLRHLRYLLQRPGETLTAFALTDLGEGREESSRPLSTTLGFDAETVRSVKTAIKKLRRERDEAEEFCDNKTIERCDAELEQLTEYLRSGTGLSGRARRETPDQKRARTAVSNAINRAIEKIGRRSRPMALHLDDHVQRGFFLRYRNSGIAWET